MPKLHFHNWAEDENGELVESEDVIDVTGPVRVQAMTERGFQTFEMAVQGLQSVEIVADEPVAEPTEAKSKTSAKSKEE